MKKGMKRISLFLAAIMLMSFCIGCGQKASDPPSTSEKNADMIAPDWKGATLTLGTLNPEGNADSVAAQWFADQLSEKTGGRLKVNVYPHAQLGNQSVQIEALTMGTQDFFIGGMEPFASIAKELQVLTVFFLFENQEQFQKFFTTQYYADAEAKLAENNIVAINKAYNWVKGPYRILLSMKHVDGSLDTIKGLTVRIPDQEVFQKSWRALGAAPTVLALNETYLAMQQGLVDSVDLIPASIASNGFQDIVKCILKTNAFPQREGVMMNKTTMDSLPEEIQEIIYETADEAGDYYTSLVEEAADKILDECRDKGIEVIEDADLSEWYAACANLGYDLEASGYLPSGITDAIKALK